MAIKKANFILSNILCQNSEFESHNSNISSRNSINSELWDVNLEMGFHNKMHLENRVNFHFMFYLTKNYFSIMSITVISQKILDQLLAVFGHDL